MSLADYEGSYLNAGWHEVQVAGIREFEANTGTQGIEFALKDERGRETKVGFYLTDKSLWRLASFAVACGLTRDQMRAYDERSTNSHRTLCGRRVKILLEKQEKYHEVTDWASMDAKVEEPTDVKPDNPKVDRSEKGVEDDDDSIPF